MKLYVTPAGRWAGTQVAAKELAREDGRFDECDVPREKDALLAFLNTHRVTPFPSAYQVLSQSVVQPPLVPPLAPVPVSYTERSISFDEAFAAMPLARKLHFAAVAMEEARELLKPAVAA